MKEICSGKLAYPPIPIGRERGAALLLILLLLALGTTFFAIGASKEASRSAQSEKRLDALLNSAKEALIAHAVAHPNRPGAFPCPDAVTNIAGNVPDDGIADVMVAGNCPSYIGRLPWRTLGIGDVRDDAGEVPWYALSQAFRDAVPINSDTHGTRIVHSRAGTVTAASEAVAVIFTPGAALGSQIRNSTAALCATTGTTIPNNWCATNYLDAASGDNNASASGPYIAAQPGTSFNDRLLVIRTPDFIPLVEQRVAREVRRVLETYRDRNAAAITGGGCNCYPWPDSDNSGTSNVGNNKGNIPLTASPHNWGASLTDTTTGTVYTLPTLPAYLQANNWQTVMYYVVGRKALQNQGQAPTACTTCSNDPLLPPPTLLMGSLSIDGTNGYAVVMITPGAVAPGQTRTNWSTYIDDVENRDFPTSDDRFITPTSKFFDRDRVYAIGDQIPPESCTPNAKVLIANLTCKCSGGQCWNQIKAACVIASQNLSGCPASCYNAGQTMVTVPCRNTLSPPQCQAALAQLRAC